MNVFISYRSEDTEELAKRLQKRLQADEFKNVFCSATSIHGGVNWKEMVDAELRISDVLIILIGDNWLAAKAAGADQKRPRDWVRYEIRFARKLNLRIIPVFVNSYTLPDKLPKDLEHLRELHGYHLHYQRSRNNDAQFQADTKAFIDEIKCFTNWAIISQYSDYGLRLREAIEAKRSDLKIVQIPPFENGEKQHFAEYMNKLDRFLEDSVCGNWLFSVYPEDDRSSSDTDIEKDIIRRLIKGKKRLVCFESGRRLRTLARKHGKRNPIGIIKTNSLEAIGRLVKHMTNTVWRKDGVRKVEIVSLMGPWRSISTERGIAYLDFFGCVQHWRHDPPMKRKNQAFQDACSDLGKIIKCTVIAKPPVSWLRQDLERAIRKFLQLRNFSDFSTHYTFVCGNDDIALTAYDLVNKRFRSQVDGGMFSFVGFDGMPAMEKLKAAMGNKADQAITAPVNFEAMVMAAMRCMRRPEKSRPGELPVLAKDIV